MVSKVDLSTANESDLKKILLAVYVMKPGSSKSEFKSVWTFGAPGINQCNGNLWKRISIHEKDQSDGSPKFRHKASPFKRFWAADLAGWTKRGGELAESSLLVRISRKFILKDRSCFICDNEGEVSSILCDVFADLQAAESISNSRW